MSRPQFGFAAHPDALNDLRAVPDRIRDLALLQLQHLVHGSERAAPLHGALTGCHKVYIDPAAEWRLVIQYRKAPAGALYPRDIHLLAVGARQDAAVYRAALQRLHPTQSAHSAATPDSPDRQAQAARSRSPHLHGSSASTAPQPNPTASPPAPKSNRPAPRTR